MHALPMFHASTVPMLHFSTFRAGRATYIMRRYDLEGYLANIEKYAITHMIVVPPVSLPIDPYSRAPSSGCQKSAESSTAPNIVLP